MTSIVLNGEPCELHADATVETLVAEFVPDAVEGAAGGRPRGVAVALNDSVVPRSAWSRTGVDEGDRVEIVTAVQGG